MVSYNHLIKQRKEKTRYESLYTERAKNRKASNNTNNKKGRQYQRGTQKD